MWLEILLGHSVTPSRLILDSHGHDREVSSGVLFTPEVIDLMKLRGMQNKKSRFLETHPELSSRG